ncbi:hypothetical protein EK21DRAFT_117380 [Setomelanomma holmii]|uniref:WW domain-containing protein n=1 Tax=Setomelanomma holmii TaxID=210430 RepID=A0A9P4GZJ7_9PLEO|nr:hypothetical protein EK21DRAFT_117380 [Setomelanomma holmii]
MTATPTHLGPLLHGRIQQYANAVGQIYYHDTVTNTTSYAIPPSYADHPSDQWEEDKSKTWAQWRNKRTGRAVLINPNPPPPQTYLDDLNVQAGINTLTRVPESDEHLYRRPMMGILRFMFPSNEGYDVVQEAQGDISRSDFAVLKVLQRPGGSPNQYEIMHVESKPQKEPWGSTRDQLLDHLTGNGNDSGNCYGMVHIGLEVQFYRYNEYAFDSVSPKMHLVDDVASVIQWGAYVKSNPLRLV